VLGFLGFLLGFSYFCGYLGEKSQLDGFWDVCGFLVIRVSTVRYKCELLQFCS